MFSSADTILPALHAALPESCFRDLTPAYLEEPRGRFQASGGVLVAPGTTDEVSTLLQLCHEAQVPVVPYAGGTGLVGGQIAHETLPPPVILSMERMTAIGRPDTLGNTLTVEGGAILQNVQEAALNANRLFPLTLASQGSARIGGLLATNAGGVNVLRYGNARDLCLGLEAVLADGTVVNTLSGLRKNNTGYDLRHLLIGSEGTLGVITKATLKLAPKPRSEAAAYFIVESPEAALALLGLARDHLGDVISAFELISGMGPAFLRAKGPEVSFPFPEDPPWMVLVDAGLSGPVSAEDALMALFEAALEAGLVSDGVLSQSQDHRTRFWALRESIPEANRRIGSVSSHDISVPLAVVPDFIARAPGAIAPLGDFRINCFGHLGDGNLHWNVFPEEGRSRADHENERPAIKRAVHDLVHELGGSVAAEHGVGRLKVDDLERYVDPGKLSAMRAVKKALDPKGILNPGVILRG